MWMQPRIWLAALCLPLFSACATSRFTTAPDSPPVVQCDAEALAPCAPLQIDDVATCAPPRAEGAGCAAAVLKADAVNRERHLDCQRRQRAAIDCLETLQARGVLKAQP